MRVFKLQERKPFIFLTIFWFCFHISKNIVVAQNARRAGTDAEQFNIVEPGNKPFRERSGEICQPDFRTFEGTCTNHILKVAGSASTAHFSYFRKQSAVVPSGIHLPSPRFISNTVCSQQGDLFNERRMSEFVTFFGQFLDHTFVATSSSQTLMDIPIPVNDPFFGNRTGALSFKRSKRAVPEPFRTEQTTKSKKMVNGSIVVADGNEENVVDDVIERPINILTSAIDLASVYGASSERAAALRMFKDGKLKTSAGNHLPFNEANLFNAPTTSSKLFVAGDHRANENPSLASLHTLFVREHNLLADELKSSFPEFQDDDEWLFQYARKINIAQFQKIVYEEFFPTVTGRSIRPYKGYRPSAVPSISVEFSTSAFRLGHTLVGNHLTMRGKNNSFMPPMTMSEMFFPSPAMIVENDIDPFIRGAINMPAQEVDTFVHDSLRNFLFSNVQNEDGFDLIALNIQRSRDHNIRSYNEIRKLFLRRPVRSFRQITSNRATQSRLQTAYGSAHKVEAWVGLLAEDHMKKSSVGWTMFKLWEEEFARLRDGDRFFYKAHRLFSRGMMKRFRRLQEIYIEKDTMAKIILRNSEITQDEVGKSVWFAP